MAIVGGRIAKSRSDKMPQFPNKCRQADRNWQIRHQDVIYSDLYNCRSTIPVDATTSRPMIVPLMPGKLAKYEKFGTKFVLTI